jgi:16S rRNA (cytosine967-C5)-methyltransferase
MALRPPGAPRTRRPQTTTMRRRPAGPASRRASVDPRHTAAAALARVREQRRPLEAALEDAPGFAALEPRDRAFARLLAATALRRAGEIDAVIARLVERPLPATARAVTDILTLGIVQLLYLDTPAHAAVATAVVLCETRGAAKFKGLVNAVLRRVAREGRTLVADLDPARINTPDWLWQGWCDAYGEDTARAIAASHLTEAPLDLAPRDAAKAARLAASLEAEVLPWGALRRRSGGAIPDLPGYADGAWWVQDAAAQIPVRLLGPVTGKRVLDLCAAPGGKTLQLAAAGARVTAVDRSAARLDIVARNLARTGLAAELIAADGAAFAAAPFDAVLLDAPCTATGTIRRHPDIARTRRPEDIAGAAVLQDRLLDNAARLTRPGGILVYAVCSLEPAEGEARIAAFLARHDFTADPVNPADLPGLPEAATAAGHMRTLPSMMADGGGIDGFFAARLRRSGEAAT